MANFHTHLGGAFTVSGVLSLAAYKAGLLVGSEWLNCVILGTLGGLLPDIDSDHSTPVKLGFDVLSLCMATALVLQMGIMWSFLGLVSLWVAAYVAVRYGVFQLFTSLTVHRGLIHSLPCMVLLALVLVCVNYYLLGTSAEISWFYGWFLLLGALVHLLLDELYSVNLLGLKIKRSFGTAFKVFEVSRPLPYLLLYVAVVALWFVAPPFAGWWRQVQDPATWWLLQQSFWPQALK